MQNDAQEGEQIPNDTQVNFKAPFVGALECSDLTGLPLDQRSNPEEEENPLCAGLYLSNFANSYIGLDCVEEAGQDSEYSAITVSPRYTPQKVLGSQDDACAPIVLQTSAKANACSSIEKSNYFKSKTQGEENIGVAKEEQESSACQEAAEQQEDESPGEHAPESQDDLAAEGNVVSVTPSPPNTGDDVVEEEEGAQNCTEPPQHLTQTVMEALAGGKIALYYGIMYYPPGHKCSDGDEVVDCTPRFHKDPNFRYYQDPNFGYYQDPNFGYYQDPNFGYYQDPNFGYYQVYQQAYPMMQGQCFDNMQCYGTASQDTALTTWTDQMNVNPAYTPVAVQIPEQYNYHPHSNADLNWTVPAHPKKKTRRGGRKKRKGKAKEPVAAAETAKSPNPDLPRPDVESPRMDKIPDGTPECV